MEKTSAEVMERERKNGMIIMAIRIMCEENKKRFGGYGIARCEGIARWLGNDEKTAKDVKEICTYLEPKSMMWDIVQEEKGNQMTIAGARKRLVTEIADRVEFVLANYPYSYDVMKEAIPFGLIDEEKGVCEENIKDIESFLETSMELYQIHQALLERDFPDRSNQTNISDYKNGTRK